MALPFFYTNAIATTITEFVLNEETSKHVIQVLRMQNGEQLLLTDGKGNLFNAEITDGNRKKCTVKILSVAAHPSPSKKIDIAISLLKNSTRFEWFLEKVTELGVSEIFPLICSRTEKQFFRHDRMKNIVISAMLQSQQTWLPVLNEPIKFTALLHTSTAQQKFIAHCEEENSKESLVSKLTFKSTQSIILIGPEGDFTKDEITQALQNNYVAVALGNTRLRTETAGVVAATILCIN